VEDNEWALVVTGAWAIPLTGAILAHVKPKSICIRGRLMPQRSIRKFEGQQSLALLWAQYMQDVPPFPGQMVLVTPGTDLTALQQEHPLLREGRLMVKPDQLFGKCGLVTIGASYNAY